MASDALMVADASALLTREDPLDWRVKIWRGRIPVFERVRQSLEEIRIERHKDHFA